MNKREIETVTTYKDSWGFTSWQTDNIKAWIARYEELIAAGSFSAKPDIEASLSYKIQQAKEELTNRLIRSQ